MTEQMTEVKRCSVGLKADMPCPFVATEPAPHYNANEPEMCAYHAADQVLHDEIDEYGIGLDKVTEWLEYARENHLAMLAGVLREPRLFSCLASALSGYVSG